MMADSLLQMGLSNACFSLALAIVAMVVGAKTKRPHLAHMLWLIVFIKLVTPPIVTIPIDTFSIQPEAVDTLDNYAQLHPPVTDAQSSLHVVAAAALSSLRSGIGTVWNHGRVWLPPIWLLGSVFVFAWSLMRVYRFNRLLVANSDVAPQELQTVAARIARRLGLKTVPTIHTTSAHLSPLVWWIGGNVRVVIPVTLLDQMDAQQSQWILAHELAHVRRRDYLVRWIEWLACVCFWWNPVAWWARYHLRANEELCCDALVVSNLKPKPHTYADSLLTAVEYLACPAIRAPAIASEINSGGQLERRFKTIVSGTLDRKTSRWLQACVMLCAAMVIPLGMGCAHDYDAVGKRPGKAVDASQLTHEHDEVMTDAPRRADEDPDEDEWDKVWDKDEDGWDEKEYYEEIGKELKAAVEAGDLTEEEAEQKLIAVREKMWPGDDEVDWDKDWDEEDAYYKEVWDKLEAAVAAGKMSQKDAEAKMIFLKNEFAAKTKAAVLGKTEAEL
jgi:beta-lactamase regulating signal transducer with metallopeptidase domain